MGIGENRSRSAASEQAGLYRSLDGGLTWQPAQAGLGRANIKTLLIDPNEPRTLYAGLSLAGVFKSTDGGSTWRPANQGIEPGGWEMISIVVMDPTDSQHLYYTSGFQPLVYETVDAGKNWRRASRNWAHEASSTCSIWRTCSRWCPIAA